MSANLETRKPTARRAMKVPSDLRSILVIAACLGSWLTSQAARKEATRSVPDASVIISARDQHGVPFPAVTVYLRKSDGTILQKKVTDGWGEAVFEEPGEGSYKVTIKLEGYDTIRDELLVDAGVDTRRSYTLKVSPQEVIPLRRSG